MSNIMKIGLNVFRRICSKHILMHHKGKTVDRNWYLTLIQTHFGYEHVVRIKTLMNK